MSAVDPEKKAIVQELLSRRATLPPEKAAIVDELAGRFGITSNAAPAQPEPAQPWYQRMFKNSTEDPRIPSGIHPEDMQNGPISDVFETLKGVAGLPKDLSAFRQPVPPLKDMLLQAVDPRNSVGAGMIRGMVDAPGNLMSGDPYRIGQGINAAATLIPVAGATKGAAASGLKKALPPPKQLYDSAARMRQSATAPSAAASQAARGLINANPADSATAMLKLVSSPLRKSVAWIEETVADALLDSEVARLRAAPKERPANAPNAARTPRVATSEPYAGNAMERPDVAPAAPYQDPAARPLPRNDPRVAASRATPAEPDAARNALEKVYVGEPEYGVYRGPLAPAEAPRPDPRVAASKTGPPAEPYNPELFRDRPVSIPEPEAPLSPDMQAIERGIGPSGEKAKRSTLRNTPRLAAEVPELAGLKPGPKFDATLMEGFRRKEAAISAAEDAVPSVTTVPKTPIIDQWTAIKEDYKSRGLELSATKVEKIIEKWKDTPEQIPWKTFVKMKRSFFKDQSTMSAPLRRSYRVLMDASGKVSEPLSEANRSYSIVRQALDDAKIDPSTGRRIMEVGKPPGQSWSDKYFKP